MLLDVHKTIDISAFTQAVAELLKTHASLRLAFNKNGDTWQQHYQDYQANWLSQVVQVSDQTPDENVIARYQAQFELAKAPLLRFVYFTKNKTLLCIAHHLIVDVVSWQIMVSELIAFYHGQCQKTKVNATRVNTEFFQWQSYLQAIIEQGSIDRQKDYWLAQLMPTSPELTPFDNSYQNSANQITTLDRTTTASLLKQVNQAYNTKPQEILLTALALTLNNHWQLPEITIELEGHGREADLLKNEKTLDLSSSIGWFTSRFPQKFKALGNDIENNIITYKEQLRHIPNKGIGFGLLCYLHPTSSQSNDWGNSDLVSFNYLGQRNSKIDEFFSLADGLVEKSRAANNQRPHLLDINIMVCNEQLHIDWCYAQSHPLFSQIKQLIESFTLTLNKLISHCLDPKQGRATASDFPLADITDEDFMGLLNELVKQPAISLSDDSPLLNLN